MVYRASSWYMVYKFGGASTEVPGNSLPFVCSRREGSLAFERMSINPDIYRTFNGHRTGHLELPSEREPLDFPDFYFIIQPQSVFPCFTLDDGGFSQEWWLVVSVENVGVTVCLIFPRKLLVSLNTLEHFENFLFGITIEWGLKINIWLTHVCYGFPMTSWYSSMLSHITYQRLSHRNTYRFSHKDTARHSEKHSQSHTQVIQIDI